MYKTIIVTVVKEMKSPPLSSKNLEGIYIN